MYYALCTCATQSQTPSPYLRDVIYECPLLIQNIYIFLLFENKDNEPKNNIHGDFTVGALSKMTGFPSGTRASESSVDEY